MPATRRAKTVTKAATEAASPIARTARGKKAVNDDVEDVAPKRKTTRTTKTAKKVPATSKAEVEAPAPRKRGRAAAAKKDDEPAPIAASAKGRSRAKSTTGKNTSKTEPGPAAEAPKRGRGRATSELAPSTSSTTARGPSVKKQNEEVVEAPKPKPRGRAAKSIAEEATTETEEKPKRGRSKKALEPQPEAKPELPKAKGRSKRARVEEIEEHIEQQEPEKTERRGRAAKRVKIVEPEVIESGTEDASKRRGKKAATTKAAVPKKAPAKRGAKTAVPAKPARSSRIANKSEEAHIDEAAVEVLRTNGTSKQTPITKARGRPRRSDTIAAGDTATEKEVDQPIVANDALASVTTPRRLSSGRAAPSENTEKRSLPTSAPATTFRRFATTTGTKGRRTTVGAQVTPKKSNDNSIPASAPAKAHGRGRPSNSQLATEQSAAGDSSAALTDELEGDVVAGEEEAKSSEAQVLPSTSRPSRRQTMAPKPSTPRGQATTSGAGPNTAPAKARGRPKRSLPATSLFDIAIDGPTQELAGKSRDVAETGPSATTTKNELPPPAARPSRRQTMAPMPSTPRSQALESNAVPKTAPAKARGRPKRSLPNVDLLDDSVEEQTQEHMEVAEDPVEVAESTRTSINIELPSPATKPSRRQTMAPKPSTPRGQAQEATGAPGTAPSKIAGRGSGRPRSSATPTTAAQISIANPNTAVETSAQSSTKRRGRPRKSEIEADITIDVAIDIPEIEGEDTSNVIAGTGADNVADQPDNTTAVINAAVTNAIGTVSDLVAQTVAEAIHEAGANATAVTVNEDLDDDLAMTRNDPVEVVTMDLITPEAHDEDDSVTDEDDIEKDDHGIVQETVEIAVVEPATPTAENIDNEVPQSAQSSIEPAAEGYGSLNTPRQTLEIEEHTEVFHEPSLQNLNGASGTSPFRGLEQLSSPLKLTATPASQAPGSPTKLTPRNSSPFKLGRAPVPPEYPEISINDLSFPSIPSDFSADLSTINEESILSPPIPSPRKSSPLKASPRKASRPQSRRGSHAPSLGPVSNNGITKPSSRASSRAPSLGPAPDLLAPSSPTKARSSRQSSRARSLGPSSPLRGQHPKTILEDVLIENNDPSHASSGDPMDIDEFDSSLHFSEIIPGQDTSTPYGVNRDL